MPAADKEMNEFKRYHPAVDFVYYLSVICFCVFIMNPVCIAISLASGIVCAVMAGGKKAVGFMVKFLLPLAVFTAVINPLFSHEGVTIIAYFPNGNPLTLESVVYGVCAGLMLCAAACHFYCMSKIITSDKIIYLTGKAMPSAALVMSMSFRFVPAFSRKLKQVYSAQKCIGACEEKRNTLWHIKTGIRAISAVMTWSMENAIDTADSMKSRGFGCGKRSTYSNYQMDKRDIKALAACAALAAYVLYGIISGKLHFRYYPSIKFQLPQVRTAGVFLAYATLCAMPAIIEAAEELRWKKLRLKI